MMADYHAPNAPKHDPMRPHPYAMFGAGMLAAMYLWFPVANFIRAQIVAWSGLPDGLPSTEIITALAVVGMIAYGVVYDVLTVMRDTKP